MITRLEPKKHKHIYDNRQCPCVALTGSDGFERHRNVSKGNIVIGVGRCETEI